MRTAPHCRQTDGLKLKQLQQFAYDNGKALVMYLCKCVCT